MKCIEENTERLILLEKTLVVEEKQKKRFEDLAFQKKKEIEEANRRQLYDGTINTPDALLNQEEAIRKELMEDMVRNATPSDGPTIKVLNNVQGTFFSMKIRV